MKFLQEYINKISDNSELVETLDRRPIINIDVLMLRKRTIFFSDEVNYRTTKNLISKLLHLSSIRPNENITLYLNCPGGDIYSGLAVLDIMDYIKCDITTIVVGLAASFGALILANGTKNKRLSTKNSRIMIHQPLTQLGGRKQIYQTTDLEILTKEMKNLKTILNQIIVEKTGQNIEKIELDVERDKYLTPNEAIKYGLIDKII